MQVDLNLLKANPFRNFEIYPLDETQVERLVQSIGQVGFFSSITARPAGDFFEIAAGHHRIEALRRAGVQRADIMVKDYDDTMMVRIMSLENLTQKGHNAAAILDAVTAYCRLIIDDVLSEGASCKILQGTTYSKSRESNIQREVMENGPGRELLYQVMNGFAIKQREAYKDAEQISSTELAQAIGTLKDSGMMAKMIADIHAKVEAKRPPPKDAEERVRANALKAQIAMQSEKRPIYDAHASNLFSTINHNDAFRKAVTTETGRRFLPVEQQVALAEEVASEIGKVEDKRGHKLGSPTVTQLVNKKLDIIIRQQHNIDDDERQKALLASARRRVEDRWDEVRLAAARIGSALSKLEKEVSEWDSAEPFPYDAVTLDGIALTAELILRLQKKLNETSFKQRTES